MKNKEEILNEQIRKFGDEETIISGISLLREDIALLDERLELLEGLDTDLNTENKKESLQSERNQKMARQDAYLDALLEVLVNNNSKRLYRSKTYGEFVKCPEDKKAAAQQAVRRYLLKLFSIYDKYLKECGTNSSKLLFSYYIDKVYSRKEQDNSSDTGVDFDSQKVENMGEEIADEDEDEEEVTNQPDNEEEREEILQDNMSPEMIQALILYYQQFKELKSLNISKKLDEFPEIIEELKTLAGSKTRKGLEEFLIQAMEAGVEAKDEFIKSKQFNDLTHRSWC